MSDGKFIVLVIFGLPLLCILLINPMIIFIRIAQLFKFIFELFKSKPIQPIKPYTALEQFSRKELSLIRNAKKRVNEELSNFDKETNHEIISFAEFPTKYKPERSKKCVAEISDSYQNVGWNVKMTKGTYDDYYSLTFSLEKELEQK